MLNISDDKKELLLKYLPDTQKDIDSGEIDPVLDVLDAKITEIGFKPNYELNDVGLKLQLLYDNLYIQNS